MFNTKLPVYGICLLLALILNAIFVFIFMKRDKLPGYVASSFLLLENMGIFLGAKVLAFFQAYDLYEGKFDLLRVGFSSYGGLIGVIVVTIFFSFMAEIPFKRLLSIVLMPVPLVYAVGKIGCFLVGCCYGVEYSGIGHIVYNYSLLDNNNINLFPVQLVESIAFGTIFIYMLYRYKKTGPSMTNVSIIFILCSLAKFLLYYLRMEHINSVLSSGQILCIIFFGLGMITYFVNRKKENNNDNNSQQFTYV